MPNFREARAGIAYAYGSNFINKQEFVLLLTFARVSQVNKSRVSVLELRQFWFRREIKWRMQGLVSFLQGDHLLKDFSYSNLLFIRTVWCFDRFQCWLNSQRSPWHCRRSFLERKQAHKIKIKCQGHASNVILKLSGKNNRGIERKLWKLTARPPVSKTPPNRSHQCNVVDFGGKLTSAQKGMRSEHVTQSNGAVVQKASIRKLPNNFSGLRTSTLWLKFFLIDIFLQMMAWK